MVGESFAVRASGPQQRIEIRGRIAAALVTHHPVDRLQAADVDSSCALTRGQVFSRARGEEGGQLRLRRPAAIRLRRGPPCPVAISMSRIESEPSWRMSQQGRPAQAVDDRHPIRETIQGVAAQDRVLIHAREGLFPPGLEPLRGHLQYGGEFRQPAGAQHGAAVVGQQTEVLALASASSERSRISRQSVSADSGAACPNSR